MVLWPVLIDPWTTLFFTVLSPPSSKGRRDKSTDVLALFTSSSGHEKFGQRRLTVLFFALRLIKLGVDVWRGILFMVPLPSQTSTSFSQCTWTRNQNKQLCRIIFKFARQSTKTQCSKAWPVASSTGASTNRFHAERWYSSTCPRTSRAGESGSSCLGTKTSRICRPVRGDSFARTTLRSVTWGGSSTGRHWPGMRCRWIIGSGRGILRVSLFPFQVQNLPWCFCQKM